MPAKLQRIAAQPWADRKRIMVSFEWEGEGPVDVAITLASPAGDIWARMLIVELNERRMDVTLHNRSPLSPGAEGMAEVQLLNGDAEVDCQSEPFVMPAGAAE